MDELLEVRSDWTARRVTVEFLQGHTHLLLGLSVLVIALFGLVVSFGRGDLAVVMADEHTSGAYALPINSPTKMLPRVAKVVVPIPQKTAQAVQLKQVQPLAGKLVGGWILNGSEQDYGYLNGSFYQFQILSPFWYQLSADGVAIEQKQTGLPIDEVMKRAAHQGVQIMPTLSGDPNIVSATLQDPAKRAAHVQAIVKLLHDHNFSGVDLNYEQLDKEDAPYFTVFLAELKTELKKENRQLSVALEARVNNDVTMDWTMVGYLADRVEIMGYDYHARTTGSPGPIGPVGWLHDVLQYAKGKIPPEKIVLALGTYGYDWAADPASGAFQGSGLTYADVQSLLADKQLSVTRSDGVDERGFARGSVPNAAYVDQAANVRHEVWFEDAASIMAKVPEAKEIGGLYFWRLGAEDHALWPKLAELK